MEGAAISYHKSFLHLSHLQDGHICFVGISNASVESHREALVHGHHDAQQNVC